MIANIADLKFKVGSKLLSQLRLPFLQRHALGLFVAGNFLLFNLVFHTGKF